MHQTGELLQQILQRPEAEWAAAIEETCASHPALAVDLREKFDVLRDSGFVGATRAPVVVPPRLGGFVLGRLLGEGGMGVVYEAREERLGRNVALKLVRPEHLLFPGARERFRREIEAVARLSHPGIVSVFTVGEEQGVPYFAMELLRGASLDEVQRELAGRAPEARTGADLAQVVAARSGVSAPSLHEGPFTGSWADVHLEIGIRLAHALAHAHGHGVVHRDVKPSNVVVTPDGRVVLLDFGLATAAQVDPLTRTGSEIGSVPYLAPEVLRGAAADALSDQYALALLLYELLALWHPFLAATKDATRARIAAGDAPALRTRNRTVPRDLAIVLAKAMERDPGRRYASVAEFGADLDRVRRRLPILARPAGALRRLSRWIERHPALATGISLGLLLVGGTPTVVAFGIAAERDRARAAEAEEQDKSYQANLVAANAALQVNDAREAQRRLLACPEGKRGFEWRHLALALDGSLQVLRGHAEEVTAVAMTADATLLASGGADGEVLLWDLHRGELLYRWHHHQGSRIKWFAFAADGSRLWIDDEVDHTSVVDVGSRAVLAERRATGDRDRVCVGADGSCLLVNQGGWRLVSLDPATLQPQREIVLQQVGPPPGDLFATDGRKLCAVAGSQLQIWELDTGRRICAVSMPRVEAEQVRSMTMSSDGEQLAVGDSRGRVTVHRVADGSLVQVLADRGVMASAMQDRRGELVFDRRGELLAVAGVDGALRVFDVRSGGLVSVQPGHEGRANGVAFGGAGMLVATAGADRCVRLWSPFGGRDVRVLEGHSGVVRRLAVTPDGSRLLSVSEDGSLRVWDPASGMPVSLLGGYWHHAITLAMTADGTRAFSTFHATVLTTDLVGMAQVDTWDTHTGVILDLAAAGDGRTLVAGTASGAVLLLDPAQHRIVRELHGHTGAVLACVSAGDNHFAYSGGSDGRLMCWELAHPDAPRILATAPLPIRALAVSPDQGSLLVGEGALPGEGAAGEGGVRRICTDGSTLWQRRCSSPVRSLVMLPDQSRVVTGHQDGTITVWDAVSGAPVLVRRIAGTAIRALACDPAGRWLAAGDSGPYGSCYLVRATRSDEAGNSRRLAAAAAAMHLHSTFRNGMYTRKEIMATLAARTDLDAELRALFETCERCSSDMSWELLSRSLDVCLTPGLPAERYEQARRIVEAYLVDDPRHELSRCVLALASARLGDAERALAVAQGIEITGQTSPDLEAPLRAARAFALLQSGRREAAAIELARMRDLAAAGSATHEIVSLWRQVEAALAR